MEKEKVLFLCDKQICGGDCGPCRHTTDIRHAKNFKHVVFGGKSFYAEKEAQSAWVYKKRKIGQATAFDMYCPSCGNARAQVSKNFCAYCGQDLRGTGHVNVGYLKGRE